MRGRAFPDAIEGRRLIGDCNLGIGLDKKP